MGSKNDGARSPIASVATGRLERQAAVHGTSRLYGVPRRPNNESSEARGGAHAARPLHVLVVGGARTRRAPLSAVVRKLGHSLQVASDGDEGLRMHGSHAFDVIICAWNARRIDGLELCRRVRAHDAGKYSYLLLILPSSPKGHLLEAANAGADGCVSDPLDRDEIEGHLVAAARLVGECDAMAKKNASLRRDSQASLRAAQIDALTGVSNRLRLDEDLEELQARAARYALHASIAMCDVDGFKKFNDFYGHLAGDEALRRIAQAGRTSLRRADHFYRYGGDEFVVVLPEQGRIEAMAAMERVRAAVEGLGIAHAPDARRPIVTVSVGVASLGGDGAVSTRDVIAQADRGLYAAKSAGGNAVFDGNGREGGPDAGVIGLRRGRGSARGR